MANHIQNGAGLSKQSWQALRKNPQLLVFPLISGIAMIIVTVLFFIPIAGSGLVVSLANESQEPTSGQAIIGIIIAFLYYLVSYTVIIFSNVALLSAVMKLIRGEEATVSDGINVAMARLGKILIYALISATIGVIARGISQSGRDSNNAVVAILAAIIGAIIQGAWNLVVFFALPILVVEDIGVIGSMRRSLEIFKQTWGEGFIGRTLIGGIGCLATLVLLLVIGSLLFVAISLNSIVLIVAVVVLAIVVFVGLSLVTGAVNGVFQASLYNDAKTSHAGPFISDEYAAQAFAH